MHPMGFLFMLTYILILNPVPLIDLGFYCVIHLVLLVPLLIFISVSLAVRNDAQLGGLGFGHITEITNFAFIDIGPLPHFVHPVG